MRISVIVPTTAGPRAIVGIISRPRLPASLVITADDYRPLDDITERYDAFAGPAGPLRRALDLGDGSFELRLDAGIETGRSWELPVALAHAAIAAGHEIVTEAPELVLWATGALDPDLAVKPDDYHLADKLAHSRARLDEARTAGARILVLLPDTAPDIAWLADIEHPRVGDFATAEALLAVAGKAARPAGEPAPSPVAPSPVAQPVRVLAGDAPRSAEPRMMAVVAAAILLVVALLGLLVWRLLPPTVPSVPQTPASDVADSGPVAGNGGSADASPATPVAPRPAGLVPGLVLVELRDISGDSCVSYLMRGTATIDNERIVDDGLLPLKAAGLCALVWRLADDARPLTLHFDDDFLTLFMASDRRPRVSLQPGAALVMRLVQQRGERPPVAIGLRPDQGAIAVGFAGRRG